MAVMMIDEGLHRGLWIALAVTCAFGVIAMLRQK